MSSFIFLFNLLHMNCALKADPRIASEDLDSIYVLKIFHVIQGF